MTDRDELGTEPPGLTQASSIEAVRSLYDRWARIYDWNPVLHLVRPARRRAVEALGLQPGDTVIDMGTGTGANLRHLRAAVGETGRVIGLDVSPRMLARAQARIRRNGWENVSLLRADIRDPPLDGPVDGVLSTFVVVMYADPSALIAAWAELLEDGTMAHLFAGPSRRPSGPVVNRLLSLYLRLFEESWGTDPSGPSPLAILADRGDRVDSGMRIESQLVTDEQHLLGLAQLRVGTVGSGST